MPMKVIAKKNCRGSSNAHISLRNKFHMNALHTVNHCTNSNNSYKNVSYQLYQDNKNYFNMLRSLLKVYSTFFRVVLASPNLGTPCPPRAMPAIGRMKGNSVFLIINQY